MSGVRFNREQLRDIIDVLPMETIDYAFAYGSGAIEQMNENIHKKTIDFIFVSRDIQTFHQDNLSLNPGHYSALRFFGAKKLSILQRNFGARLYYNTLIKSKDGKRKFKYGIIAVDDLILDLLDWRWLYAAGRLHKPVLNVIEPIGTEEVFNPSQQASITFNLANPFFSSLKNAIVKNRKSAAHVALLQMPDSFTYKDLFCQIIGLSFTGDFRMNIGEDRNKISKILHGAMDGMMEIYSPIILNDPRLIVRGERIDQDNSSQAIYHRLNLLPCAILDDLNKFYKQADFRERDVEEIVFSMAHRHDVSQRINESIASIVRPAVFRQTLLNGLSAGIVKSIMYSSAKLFKMLKSLR